MEVGVQNDDSIREYFKGPAVLHMNLLAVPLLWARQEPKELATCIGLPCPYEQGRDCASTGGMIIKSDPKIHHRRSIRLAGYDYTQPGAYFVTINTWHRQELFGEIKGGEMSLNGAGLVARKQWERIPQRFPHVDLGEYVVMPDHLHGILIISCKDTADDSRGTAGPLKESHIDSSCCAPTTEQYGKPVPGSIGTIIRSYKSAVSLRLNLMRRAESLPVWQRNYYEHIIRNEKELHNISLYIKENPINWKVDEVKAR